MPPAAMPLLSDAAADARHAIAMFSLLDFAYAMRVRVAHTPSCYLRFISYE